MTPRTWRLATGGAALLIAAALAHAGPAPDPKSGGADALDFTSILTDKDEVLKSGMADAGEGDHKEFKITTDDNTTDLKVDDVYKSEQSYFKVIRIDSQGAKGGTFVVSRTHGRANPGMKFTRVSGSGPLTIVARQRLLDLYLAGGFLMHPIMLCFVAMVILTLNNLWIYRHSRQIPAAFVRDAEAALDRKDVEAFGELAHGSGGLLPIVFRAVTEHFWSSTTDELRRRAETEAQKQVERLRLPLRGLNLVAAISPLLGLLGTVTGMVACFEAIGFEQASASKAQMLAAGIRVALFTTVGGLSVAIPSLIAYFFCNSRLTGIVSESEAVAERFMNKIARIKRSAAQAAKAPRAEAPAAREA